MAELNVKLTATIKDLESALNKAKGDLKEFGDEAEKAGKKSKDGLEQANEGSKVTEKGFSNLAIAGVGLSVIAVELFRAFSKLGHQGTVLSDTLKWLTGTTNTLAIAKRDLANESSKGVANTAGEIAVLNSLLSIARDETESKENRQRALNKINKEYKELLPNMNLENVNLKENLALTDDLTKSLIRKAKIQGAQSLIAKETAKILELQNKELIDNANFWDLAAATALSVVTATDIRDRAIEAGAKRTSKGISEAEARIQSFTKILQELLRTDVDENGVFSKVTIAAQKLKSVLTESSGASVPVGTFDVLLGELDSVDRATIKLANKINYNLGIIDPKAFKVEELEKRFTEAEIAFENFNEEINNIIQYGLVDALSGIGEAIGTAFAEGGNVLGAVGKSLLGVMGGIMKQLGTATIAAGVATIALENLFSNPYTAIAAGVALVAIGSALSSARSSVSGIGSGSGSVAGQGGSGSGSSSGSSTTFVGGSSGFGEVVFRINGQDLVGVLSRATNKNTRFGG